MNKRKLGNELEVSEIGLGCMGMSAFYGAAASRDETEAIATIHRALDLGINFLDTADMYGPYTNEELVGRAVKGKRDQFIIATKFGIQLVDGDPYKRRINGTPEYVREACEASLKRLGIETIDLYYQHRVDPNTPIEETVGAMAKLVEEGKVRYIGLSEASAQTLRRASKVHKITALQTEYSLWSRDVEDEILATCRELGIGFVPYSPLGRGFLTGRFRSGGDFGSGDYRNNDPRMGAENLAANLAIVEALEGLATAHEVTPAQMAIAWVLAQGEDVVPIPGTKRLTRLEENVAATRVRLSAEELAALDALPRPRGDRFADMSHIDS